MTEATGNPVGMLQWIRRGVHLREALDQRPPSVEIGPASKALLDHRHMMGGGSVPLPSGTWTLNETLVIGSNISLTGDGRDATVLQAGGDLDTMLSTQADTENVFIGHLNFVGNGRSTCVKRSAT